jgi:hypothetical protein
MTAPDAVQHLAEYEDVIVVGGLLSRWLSIVD